VPAKYDVVINGEGYMFDRRPEVRAQLGYTPTFLDRQNVSGAYGDNAQDFFLTASQHNWVGGEGQHFISMGDPDSASSYRVGTAVNVAVPGKVTLLSGITSKTPAGAVLAACGGGFRLESSFNVHAFVVGANLYEYDGRNSNTITDDGAHGAGTVAQWGLCTDGEKVYIAGATKLRQFTVGGGFADFSATPTAGSIAFLNNTLYATNGGSLYQYDTAGVRTTLFSWQTASGVALTDRRAKLAAFGGDLLIYHSRLVDRPELWMYDGDGTFRIADLPPAVVGHDILVNDGVVYLSGLINDTSTTGVTGPIPIIYAYVNGTLSELWRSETASGASAATATSAAPALGCIAGKVAFNNSTTHDLLQYDPLSGAITTLGAVTNGLGSVGYQMSSTIGSVLLTRDKASSPSMSLYPGTAIATTGNVQSSAFDFDNTLTKSFRSIKVEWSGSGTVDIAYAVDDDTLTPSFTTLQTGAVSGTEYTLSTSGRRIVVRVTLNASGSNTPSLKRVYVRAAPLLQSYRKAVYRLDCSGRNGKQMVECNDGTPHARDGLQMLASLRAALGQVVTITDHVSTYSGELEAGGFQADVVNHREFIVTVPAREV
jgi:hypothetical protein